MPPTGPAESEPQEPEEAPADQPQDGPPVVDPELQEGVVSADEDAELEDGPDFSYLD